MDLLLNILTDESNRSLLDDNRWLLMGLGLLAVMYIVVRPFARRKKDPLAQPSRIGLSQQRSVEREMSNLLVELSEMSRQVTAQLDTRAARLEALIAEADERIAALKAMSQDSANGVRELGDESRLRFPESNGRIATIDPTRSPPPDRNPIAESTLRPGSTSEPDPRHIAVYDLADHGRSPHEIAEKLGRPSGEIELILALRSKT